MLEILRKVAAPVFDLNFLCYDSITGQGQRSGLVFAAKGQFWMAI